VAPPRAPPPKSVDTHKVPRQALLGIPLPVVVASPFKRGDPTKTRVDSTLYDNTSILKLIEWRWNLRPLTARDASSDVGNLVTALDLRSPDPSLPALPQPEPPIVVPCLPELPDPFDEVELSDLIALVPFAAATGAR
jgi:phospholipase C